MLFRDDQVEVDTADEALRSSPAHKSPQCCQLLEMEMMMGAVAWCGACAHDHEGAAHVLMTMKLGRHGRRHCATKQPVNTARMC